ncbi:unnamed protein product [Periconia digitata]|uniref:Uncharacterized protein n=1 Tax=Periconia digitata TaxID=1303443 RepID=A0A9W4UHL5_9PLEO|nr:unnamed protein product [Periconia digitata]
MGAISKICAIALLAGSLGVNASGMEHQARAVSMSADSQDALEKTIKDIPEEDIIKQFKAEYINTVAKNVVGSLPDTAVNPFAEPPKASASNMYPTVTGTSPRYPVTTGYSHPPSNFPYNILGKPDVCIYQLAPLMGHEEETAKLAVYANTCIPSLLSAYPDQEKCELQKVIMNIVMSFVRAPITSPQDFAKVKDEQTLQEIRAMAKEGLTKDELLNKLKELALNGPKDKSKRNIAARQMSDDEALRITGMYAAADAIKTGDKKLVESKLNNLRLQIDYLSTDTRAQNDEIESKARKLIFSIPSSTPLDKIQKRLAKLVRLIISSGPAKDMTKKFDEWVSEFASPNRRRGAASYSDPNTCMEKIAVAQSAGVNNVVDFVDQCIPALVGKTAYSKDEKAALVEKVRMIVLSIPPRRPIEVQKQRTETVRKLVAAKSSYNELIKQLNKATPALLSVSDKARSSPHPAKKPPFSQSLPFRSLKETPRAQPRIETRTTVRPALTQLILPPCSPHPLYTVHYPGPANNPLRFRHGSGAARRHDYLPVASYRTRYLLLLVCMSKVSKRIALPSGYALMSFHPGCFFLLFACGPGKGGRDAEV